MLLSAACLDVCRKFGRVKWFRGSERRCITKERRWENYEDWQLQSWCVDWVCTSVVSGASVIIASLLYRWCACVCTIHVCVFVISVSSHACTRMMVYCRKFVVRSKPSFFNVLIYCDVHIKEILDVVRFVMLEIWTVCYAISVAILRT